MVDSDAKDRGERLRQAAALAGYDSPKTVIDAFARQGVTNSYYQHQKGNIGFSFKAAQVYAACFDVRAEWLYSGLGPMRDHAAPPLPIIGNVAAGIAHFEDAFAKGAASDYLDPPDFEGRIALRVTGDSMAPLAHDGDYAIFGLRHDDPTALIGRRVMAVLEDNRKLFKVLRHGQTPGSYSLYSLNSAYDPIKDVHLQWVLPLEWIKAK